MGGFSTTYFLGALLAFIFGTGFAKGMQAFVAFRLGDRLPRSEGRLSFSPTRHHEPLGLLLALFLGLNVPVVAWGKPLNLNPFANRLRRIGGTLVALAGPLTYILLGVVSGLILRSASDYLPNFFNDLLYAFTYFSFLLAAFNLLPIPPMDGYGIIKGLLSPNWEPKLVWLETYGPILILVLTLLLPFLLRINLVYIFFTPIVNLLMSLVGLPSPL
jgi:Zn-dependent protease